VTSSVETEILLNVKHPPRTLGKILPVLSNEAELEGSRVATSHVNQMLCEELRPNSVC
jgi:hypothetical protein